MIRHLRIPIPANAQSIRSIALTLFIFLSPLASSIPATSLEQRTDNTNGTAEIRAVLRAQQDAWNRGDIDGFMKGYARSRSTTFVSEDTVRRGWETVRDRYRKKYSDRAKMGALTFSDLEIVPLGSNAAVVLGRWHPKRARDNPHGRFTLIFRRMPEGWRIVHDHTSVAASN